MDTYNENKITKKRVACEEVLEYYPSSISVFFIQDRKVPFENMITGLIRRFVFAYIEVPEFDEDDLYNRFIHKEMDFDKASKIINNIKNTEFDWSLTKGAMKLSASHIINFLKPFENNSSMKEIISTLKTSLHNVLIKMCCIKSAYWKYNNMPNKKINVLITEDIVKEIIPEFNLLIESMFKYIELFVEKSFETPCKYSTEILSTLIKNGAKNKESAMYTEDLLKEVIEFTGKSFSSIRNSISVLKKKGFLDTDIIGKPEGGKPNSIIWSLRG